MSWSCLHRVPPVHLNGWKLWSPAPGTTCLPTWRRVSACGNLRQGSGSKGPMRDSGGNCLTQKRRVSTTTTHQAKKRSGTGLPTVISYHWRNCRNWNRIRQFHNTSFNKLATIPQVKWLALCYRSVKSYVGGYKACQILSIEKGKETLVPSCRISPLVCSDRLCKSILPSLENVTSERVAFCAMLTFRISTLG